MNETYRLSLEDFIPEISRFHTLFLSFTAILLVVGFIMKVKDSDGDFKKIANALLSSALVILLIVHFQEALIFLHNCIFDECSSIKDKAFGSMLSKFMQTTPYSGQIDSNVKAMGEYIRAGGIELIMLLSRMKNIFFEIQEILYNLFYMVSPLTLAYLAWDVTKNDGVKFIKTVIGVVMWTIALAICDMFIAKIFSAVTSTSIGGSINFMVYIVFIFLIFILSIIIYVVGILSLQKLLSGGSPLSAVSSGLGMAGAAAGIAAGGAGLAMGAAKMGGGAITGTGNAIAKGTGSAMQNAGGAMGGKAGSALFKTGSAIHSAGSGSVAEGAKKAGGAVASGVGGAIGKVGGAFSSSSDNGGASSSSSDSGGSDTVASKPQATAENARQKLKLSKDKK